MNICVDLTIYKYICLYDDIKYSSETCFAFVAIAVFEEEKANICFIDYYVVYSNIDIQKVLRQYFCSKLTANL